MRIALVAPLIESVPPKTYGGSERVVHYLTEELVDRGHEVTLFASGDSCTRADLVALVPESLRKSSQPHDQVIWHLCQLMEVMRMADRFDTVHFHTDFSHFPLMRYAPIPHVMTLHGRLDVPDFDILFHEFSEMPVVSISDSQRRSLPGANWVATVYNGIPAVDFQFRPESADYFAFLGRISPEKGPEQAIEIAIRLNTPLRMAAKIDTVDRDYFASVIEPKLAHPLIEYIGEVDLQGKNELLGGAKALLFPIQWPEPFGLVMIEAMACGTPVIAFRNGSVDEVMRDGVSGLIVESVDEAVAAAGRIEQIDRAGCRQYFEQSFSAQRMVDGYLEVYRRLVRVPVPLQPGRPVARTSVAAGGAPPQLPS